MPHNAARRQFVLQLASVSAVVAGGSALSGCGGDGEAPVFMYGVASGDPQADRVILWTHARFPSLSEAVQLRYEVADDASFKAIVSSGQVTASAATGYTAKVDATGLAPGKTYYYRFTNGWVTSPVGITRTLPAATSELRLAVLSCANYPAGLFNIYAEVAQSDAHFAIHLGDYIYEYDAAGYASADAAALGRTSVPANELRTLDDYRQRHAQYKSDADSKAMHART